MGLRFTRLFGDENGETHFADFDLPTTLDSMGNGVDHLAVPAKAMVYVEYPEERPEIIPGLHDTPARHFIVCLQGGYEITTSTGEVRTFRAGDWVLADDIGSKGHLTRGVGPDRRVSLIIGLDDAWTLPETEVSTQ